MQYQQRPWKLRNLSLSSPQFFATPIPKSSYRRQIILSVCAPFQVLDSIVKFVSVDMVDAFLSLRLHQKCLCNQPMNRTILQSLSIKQNHSPIAAPGQTADKISSAVPTYTTAISTAPPNSRVTPYFSFLANCIQSFVAPNIFHHIDSSKMTGHFASILSFPSAKLLIA